VTGLLEIAVAIVAALLPLELVVTGVAFAVFLWIAAA
jgi:hypothetical protein